MLQDASDEGAEPDLFVSYPGLPITILQSRLDGNEIETVESPPDLIESKDVIRVSEETDRVVSGLVTAQESALLPLRKKLLLHRTILFLIEQSASFCHRGFWLLGWRLLMSALDACAKVRERNELTNSHAVYFSITFPSR